MRILAIETSEYVSSIALWNDGAISAETFPSRMDLCEKLTGRIRELLQVTPARQAGVDAVAISQGPGSFTGLRVGMATAKALSHVLAIPLIGVPTQEAIAAAAEVGEGERLLVLQHARRDHVYAGVWARSDGGVAELTAPQVVPNEELPSLIDGITVVTGPATDALIATGAQLPAAVVVRQSHPQAATIADLAATRAGCADPRAAFTLQPLYLLPSQAERMKNVDISGGGQAGVGPLPNGSADPPGTDPSPHLRIRRASLDDLPDVVRIENLSFPSPWSEVSLRDELSGRLNSLFLIAEVDGRLAGYVGAWVFAGEAHICTLAVDPPYRRCGLGEIMLLTLLQLVRAQDVRYAILEYRASNVAAAGLYRKLGFDFVHRRRGYYQDTNEDAIVAAIPDLETPDQRARLDRAADQWTRRYHYEVTVAI